MGELYERSTIKMGSSTGVILPIGWVRKQRQKLNIPEDEDIPLIVETNEDTVILTIKQKTG